MICLKRFLFVAVSFVCIHDVFAQAEVQNPSFPFWKIKGNSGTNSGTDFIGTTDNVSWRIRTNNLERVVVDSLGQVGIKIATPQTFLDINGDYAYRVSNLLNTTFDNNNVDLISNKFSSYRITSTYGDDFRYSGFAGGTNGRIVTLYNASNEKIDLLNQSNLSLANNRIITGSGGDVTIGSQGSVTLQYNTVDNKWVVLSVILDDPGGNDWHLTGNSGTNASANFVGTIDNQDLTFRVNNVPKMRLFASNGRLELYGNSTDSSTIFIGRNTGSGSTSANGIFIGKDVGLVNSGNFNTMIGLRSGRANTTGFENTFIGYQTGRDNLSGRENTFLGSAAGQANTIGSTNVFVGNAAGASNLDGSSNTIVGSDAGSANVSGDVNVLIGNRSGRLVTVSNNTIVGGDAGFNTTTGGNNTFVGRSTGATNVTGGLNTMLGIDADLGFDNLTNATAIGARAQVDASNSLVLGSVNGVNGASSTVSVGIGVNAPLRTFHIGGLTSGFRYAGVATGGSFISTPSAVTDKLLFADANGDVRALNNGSNGQTLQIVAGAPQWSSGLVGPTGPTGAAGTNGTNGATGPAGPTGAAGTNGANGATGLQGPTGAAGTNGANGATGPAGPTGAAGTNGANGATGPQGPTGAAGTNGANGATGPAGPTGAAGTNGTNGATGPQGPTGAAGTNGATGAAGATGPQGPIGPTGPAGSSGGTAWDLIGNTGTTASTAAIGSAVNNNFIGTTDTKDFVLATNNLERMRLLADGRFGVGTLAPATGVNAEFAYSGDFIFRLNTTSAGKVGLDFFRPGAGSFDWRIINDGGALNIFRGSNDFSIAPTDGYRFNSTNTAFHPTVTNTKTLGLPALVWSNVYTTDVFGANAYTVTSDIRTKENIKPIQYGLKEVMKLRPVNFNMIQYPEFGLKLGLIAQELKTVLPEVVRDWEWKVDEKTGERTKVEAERMGVMYSDIIPVLIKAIQEQEANAQKSREEIELLKQELAKLKAGKQ